MGFPNVRREAPQHPKQERTGTVFVHAPQSYVQCRRLMVMADLASSRRIVLRPPKNIRVESKRIAHVTHQMFASSVPMCLIKERLSCMLGPMCKNPTNVDYTLSVLRAACSAYTDMLEAIVDGEENPLIAGGQSSPSVVAVLCRWSV